MKTLLASRIDKICLVQKMSVNTSLSKRCSRFLEEALVLTQNEQIRIILLVE